MYHHMLPKHRNESKDIKTHTFNTYMHKHTHMNFKNENIVEMTTRI